MIRAATPADGAVLEGFLARHPDSSMFLRGNLAAHGVGPDPRPDAHPNTTRFWIIGDSKIAGVFGVTQAGMLMCQMPSATPRDWRAVETTLAGLDLAGMTGEDGQVQAVLAALNLPREAFTLNEAEPLYRLHLCDLEGGEGELRAAVEADLPLLSEWNRHYLLETGIMRDSARAEAAGRERALRAVGNAATQILIEQGRPVAMSMLNAQVGDMVQIGGVYVPPERRSGGRGRRVVAAQLRACRARGVRTAILFSNNKAASRAYESIGFERIGLYRIAMLDRPRCIGAAS